MYLHSAVDIPALLTCCQQAQGPVVLSCEDDAEVSQQAAALGLNLIRVRMHSATNRQMGELLMSNRPLPNEPPTPDIDEAAQLTLGID